MLVKCLYRMHPQGELIQSKYDTDLGLIKGLSKDIFNIILKPEQWSPANYKHGHTYYVGYMEAYMLHNRTCYVCIEVNNYGFYALHIDGRVDIVYDTEYNSGTVMYFECAVLNGKFVPIGYRPTVALQYSVQPTLQCLVYDMDTGLCYTNQGPLKCGFDLFDLTKVSPKYEGYKEMVEKEYDAVVYINGIPKFLKIIDNELRVI